MTLKDFLAHVGIEVGIQGLLKDPKNIKEAIRAFLEPVNETTRSEAIGFIHIGMTDVIASQRLWNEYLVTFPPEKGGKGKPGEENDFANFVGRLYLTYKKKPETLQKVFAYYGHMSSDELKAVMYAIKDDSFKQSLMKILNQIDEVAEALAPSLNDFAAQIRKGAGL